MNKFFGDAITNMLCYEVSIDLRMSESISEGGIECSGMFESDPLMFRCAMKKPYHEWMEVFVHEYCHFDQWLHKHETSGILWSSVNDKIYAGGESVSSLFFGWLGGDLQLDNDEIFKFSRMMRDLELDCELMVICKNAYYDLGIDVSNYIRKSNAYLYFYSIVPEIRCWSASGRAPYMIPSILEIMPDEFQDDYDIVPDGYLSLVRKYCF